MEGTTRKSDGRSRWGFPLDVIILALCIPILGLAIYSTVSAINLGSQWHSTIMSEVLLVSMTMFIMVTNRLESFYKRGDGVSIGVYFVLALAWIWQILVWKVFDTSSRWNVHPYFIVDIKADFAIVEFFLLLHAAVVTLRFGRSPKWSISPRWLSRNGESGREDLYTDDSAARNNETTRNVAVAGSSAGIVPMSRRDYGTVTGTGAHSDPGRHAKEGITDNGKFDGRIRRSSYGA